MTKNDHPAVHCHLRDIAFSKKVPIAINPHDDSDAPINELHYHRCLEISTCTKGYGIALLAHELYSYHSGDVLMIPPGCPHGGKSASGTKASWNTAYINLEMLGQHELFIPLLPIRIPLAHLEASRTSNITRLMDVMVTEYHKRDKYQQACMHGYMAALIAQLLRISRKRDLPYIQNHHLDRLAPAINRIARNLSQPLPISQLASLCHLSEPQFRRLFKQQVGSGPKQYISQMRLELAQSILLNTDDSVLEISYACGYDSISAFNRAFKNYKQMTPMEFRTSSRYRQIVE